MPDRCPCDSGRACRDGSAPLHAGAAARDAERLMRSRYSAFVLGLADDLLASWLPDTGPSTLELDPPGVRRWLRLRVLAHQAIDADRAEVELVTRSRVGGGSAQGLHERSRFCRIEGYWYDLDAH